MMNPYSFKSTDETHSEQKSAVSMDAGFLLTWASTTVAGGVYGHLIFPWIGLFVGTFIAFVIALPISFVVFGSIATYTNERPVSLGVLLIAAGLCGGLAGISGLTMTSILIGAGLPVFMMGIAHLFTQD